MRVLFAEGKGPIPSIIQAVTDSRISHVALQYSVPDSHWLVHSTVGGIQPDWMFYFVRKYRSVLAFDALFTGADDALDKVVERLAHKPFDYLGMLGQGISIIFGTGNPFRNKARYRCTELLIEWHREVMKTSPHLAIADFDPEMTTPGELLAFCRHRADLFREVDVAPV